MFGFGPATRIYVATGATDLRKGFDGLYGLVRDRLECDPASGHASCVSAAALSSAQVPSAYVGRVKGCL